MKRLGLIALSFVMLLGSAAAQVVPTFVPLGYCQITSLATAKKLTTCSGGIPSGATVAIISIEGASIRYRDDQNGTLPTASVGMPIGVGQAFQYTGTLSLIQIIEQSASAKANILFYR